MSEFSDLVSQPTGLMSECSNLVSEFSDHVCGPTRPIRLLSKFSDLMSEFSFHVSEPSQVVSEYPDLMSEFSSLGEAFTAPILEPLAGQIKF